MKTISKAALAMLLSLGAVPMLATPAVAKGKDQEEAPKVSEAFRKIAVQVQPKIEAKDWAGADPLVATAEAAAQSDTEHFYASLWRAQVAGGQNNLVAEAAALDQLIANPTTPAAQLPQFYFFRGQAAMQLKKPAEALPFLKRAQQLGYPDPDGQLAVQIGAVAGDAGDLAGMTAAIDKAVATRKAAGQKPPEDWYKYVVSRLYKSGDRTGAANWLSRELADYPGPENWRNTILVFRDSTNAAKEPLSRQEKLDLFRLQKITGALAGGSDYVEYANAAQNSGLPWEAKQVIEAGRTSGKLAANDPSATAIFSAATSSLAREQPLSTYEKQAQASASGKLSAQTADAYLASGDSAKAVALYRAALQKGGVDTDEVNTRLGIALANTGDKAGAKAAFALVKQAPRADIARFWITYLDQSGQ